MGNRHNRVRPAFNKQLPIYNRWVRLLRPLHPSWVERGNRRERLRERGRWRGWMNNADKMPIRASKRKGPTLRQLPPSTNDDHLRALPRRAAPQPRCLNMTFTQQPPRRPDTSCSPTRQISRRQECGNSLSPLHWVALCKIISKKPNRENRAEDAFICEEISTDCSQFASL